MFFFPIARLLYVSGILCYCYSDYNFFHTDKPCNFDRIPFRRLKLLILGRPFSTHSRSFRQLNKKLFFPSEENLLHSSLTFGSKNYPWPGHKRSGYFYESVLIPQRLFPGHSQPCSMPCPIRLMGKK